MYCKYDPMDTDCELCKNGMEITNPLTERKMLRTAVKPLAAAAEWENQKREKYHHLRKPNIELVPFVLETTGRFGVDAVKLLKRGSQLPDGERGRRGISAN
eukprot:gb/GECG01003771.1/.p1 GENE.gb/GECG01003771.1/~~gb/GECG01003771.1/.p1  ORF type:complete len:101 (+),score=10.32 gb/GECG01003771.1/:1-303(+)